MAKKAASKVVTPDVIDVAPENPEMQLAIQESNPIVSFLAGFKAFLTEAGEMETKAKTDLGMARLWARPTTLEEDEALVARIRANNQEQKAIEAKWHITSVMHQFHRRLTAARDRATGARATITRIGNDLHNDYAAEQKRKEREEEDRRRRADEERARLEREQELATIEQQALAAEASSPNLSEREAQFVDYYTGPYSVPATAARQAGYKNPDQAAARLLATPKIETAIKAKRDAQALREQAAAKREAPLPATGSSYKAPTQVATDGRTTWSCEVEDYHAFMAVLLDPKLRAQYGIPASCADYKQTELNELARSLHEQLNRVPGLRAKKNTRV